MSRVQGACRGLACSLGLIALAHKLLDKEQRELACWQVAGREGAECGVRLVGQFVCGHKELLSLNGWLAVCVKTHVRAFVSCSSFLFLFKCCL